MNNYDQRFKFIADDTYFDRCGPAVAWVGADGNPTDLPEDRFASWYFRQSLASGQLIECEPLIEEGMQALSLKDAIALGFTTSEYQTGLRVQMLTGYFLESEAQLLDEMLPPRSYPEAVMRAQAKRRDEDWEIADPEATIPYPEEEWFAYEKAVGWAMPDGRLMKGTPDDRFTCPWLVRDRSTGELRYCSATIGEIGIESLSLQDALKLGFSTVEYRTALRVRIFERRHLASEQDLAESICPPRDVQDAFNSWGRIFLESERDRELRASNGDKHDFKRDEEPIRRWMDRLVDRSDLASAFMRP